MDKKESFSIQRLIVNGLLTLLPLAVTLAVCTWLVQTVESLFSPFVIAILPEGWYLPGLGIVIGIFLLLVISILLNAWIIQVLHARFESLLDRLPIVRDVYRWTQNLTSLFGGDKEENKGQPVVVRLHGMKLIGIRTVSDGSHVHPKLGSDEGEEEKLVAVYCPMSYQVGGYTIFVPESACEPIDWSFQEAMEAALTAAITKK